MNKIKINSPKPYHGTIYIIRNQCNNKVYIGKTSRKVTTRFWEHTHRDLKQNNIFHRAIKKYGVDNFYYEILESDIPSLEALNEREKYWIKKFDSKIPNGYNTSDGGDGGPQNPSFDLMKYWSEKTEKEYIEHQKQANQAAQQFWKNNPEKFQECQDKRVQESLKWRDQHPDEAKRIQEKATQMAVKKNSIAIEKYNLTTGDTIESFDSANQASRITGVDASSIRKCCKGILKGCTDKRDGVKYGWREK